MTRPEDDDVIDVGAPMPRIAIVEALHGFDVAVEWDGGRRAGKRDVVDLTPAVFRFAAYAPLRQDPALFRSVRLERHRFGIAWGSGDGPDMSAVAIEDLAAEGMSPGDFEAFMRRHDFTLDGVAAELGITRRMAAFYRKRSRVPRTLALACRYIDLRSSIADGEPRADRPSPAV